MDETVRCHQLTIGQKRIRWPSVIRRRTKKVMSRILNTFPKMLFFEISLVETDLLYMYNNYSLSSDCGRSEKSQIAVGQKNPLNFHDSEVKEKTV